MILDARCSEAQIDRSATVVVVGAGPAGIVVARELAGLTDVLLVEAGGDAEQPWQLEGESEGLTYPLDAVRARQLGGSSVLWAGYCAAFGPEDFSRRDWLPMSGWPITASELAPYCGRAAAAMGVAPETRIVAEGGFDAERLQIGRWTFAPATQRFVEDVRALAAMPSVDVMTHASATDIRLDRGHSSVREVVVRTEGGREGRIRCQQLVLACGGIETPRLLLAASRQIPDGIGNAGGMVGRCFMEHPHRILRGIRLKGVELFERSARRMPDRTGRDEMLNFALPASLREQLRLLNARAHAFRFAAMDESEAPLLGLMMEQAPNPTSRIKLGKRTDRVSLPLVRLDWQLTRLDHDSFVATAEIVGAELERAGLAEVVAAEDPSAAVEYCCHQLGTTRMSENPTGGVTDLNCQVHGIDNLHIAGGSVFSTSSWANPTYMVLVLAFRLADRLKALTSNAAQSGGINR